MAKKYLDQSGLLYFWQKIKAKIPTKTSDITNDSGFIDNTYHDSTKQDELVSGTNIKTINNESVLGSGNISVGEQNYSTTEQVIGTFLGKPLYRITLEATSPSQVGTWKTLYSGNTKAIINYGGYMVGSTVTNWAIPFNTTNSNYWFSTQYGEIRMATDDNGYLNKNIYVWFEYTKTTD